MSGQATLGLFSPPSIWDVTSANGLSGSSPKLFSFGDRVLFDDSSANTVVDLGSLFLNPGSVTVHTAQDYIFAGRGRIMGATTSLMEAKPKMHIAYLREAYENADNNAVRLTFDRAVESAPNPNGNLIAKSEQAHRVFDPNLVLELKFTERFPNWFCELVQTFHCVQTGAAKFAEGIHTRGESWVTRACPRKSPESLVDEFLSGTSFP